MRDIIKAMVLAALLCAPVAAWASGQGQDPGLTSIPDLELSGPVSPAAAAYLGAPPGQGSLRLSQVQAKVLLIEVFSMYCPYCQAEAGNVNDLHARLKKSPWAGSLKMLGLGAGNTPFEVDFFRDKYKTAFPLFPDPEFAGHKALHGPGTPYFLLVRPDGAGAFTVLYSHLGGFGDPAKFLDTLAAKAGLR